MYERQFCSMNDILTYVWKYSNILQDKSSVGFGRWCSGKDIDLTHTTTKRKKVDKQTTISLRSLQVLKEKYIANAIKYIVEQLPRYQQTIESFKKDGYNVIGYVREYRTKETDETRTKLLNMMCKTLKRRSMVDKIFVSFKTNANEPITDREIDDGKKVLEEIDADGNTQDMLKYVSAQKICLVTLAFATNVGDLVAFFTKVCCGQPSRNNTIAIFDRKEQLNNQEKIQQFKCRTGFDQRSK